MSEEQTLYGLIVTAQEQQKIASEQLATMDELKTTIRHAGDASAAVIEKAMRMAVDKALLRDGSFSSVRELESSITTFLALRNAQPTRYVWNAEGEDILNKIQRAREAMASQV